MSFKQTGQTVKQCLGCSTGMEVCVSYSLRCHRWGSVCRTGSTWHHAFKHHPLSASAAQWNMAKLPCLVWISWWLHVYRLPTIWMTQKIQEFPLDLPRAPEPRCSLFRTHEGSRHFAMKPGGLVRQELLNSLLKWKAIVQSELSHQINIFLLGHPTMCLVFGQPLLKQIDNIQKNKENPCWAASTWNLLQQNPGSNWKMDSLVEYSRHEVKSHQHFF